MPRFIEVDLPCGKFYNITTLILDLNGTLTVDGKWSEGVEQRLLELTEILDIHILSADTNQTMDTLLAPFRGNKGITIKHLESGKGDIQKLTYLNKLGCENTAAIGNGCNDAFMLKDAAIGICIVGKEGASTKTLLASDVVFHNVCDALDIFLKPNRMIATLRK